MNFKYYLKSFLLGYLVVTNFGGCRKFIEVDPPANTLTSETVFADSANVESAITGMYSWSVLGTSLFDGRLSLFTGLLADELTTTTTSLHEFQTNSLSAVSSNVASLWSNAYKQVYYANAIINGVQNSSGLSPTYRNKAISEAKLYRAWWYFHMINLWGDLPLVTSSDYNETALLPRTATTQVYQLIIKDLKEGQANLPIFYQNSDRTRPNQAVATALLTKVYAFLGDWANAENEANKLISSNVYMPLPTPANTFLKGSKETIWQVTPISPSYNTVEGNTFIPSNTTTIPVYQLASTLVNSFETGDQRRTAWVNSNTVGGVTYYYPAKYKIRTSAPGFAPAEYNVMLRMADIILIRAEALIQDGRTPQGIADINTVRTRSGLAELPSNLTKEQALLAVEQERRIELFVERGARWLDLIRTHRATAVLQPLKGSDWQVTDTLLPIPAGEIVNNSNLVQNTGY
jgi:starch-binding outer membrane protein, SusD/RagB family